MTAAITPPSVWVVSFVFSTMSAAVTDSMVVGEWESAAVIESVIGGECESEVVTESVIGGGRITGSLIEKKTDLKKLYVQSLNVSMFGGSSFLNHIL